MLSISTVNTNWRQKMPNNDFRPGNHLCCQHCKTKSPRVCPAEYQMSVLMTKKCLGFSPMGGLLRDHYRKLFRLEVKDANV